MAARQRLFSLALTAATIVALTASPTDAGGRFGLHVGGDTFSVTVGFGDWGVYGRSWHDPSWSLDFDLALAGYGEWVWVNGLGRVWRPWVTPSWRPYSHGRWVATGAGWTWVAYEPWGYIPHHYGHWAYCDFGWVWLPGSSYVAANVVWVRAGGYVGWYPRAPRGWSHAQHGFRHGFRQGYHHGYGDGYRDGWYDARHATWVDWRHFGSDNIAHRAVSHSVISGHRLDHATSPPAVSEVQRRSISPVPESRLLTRTVRSGSREITVARPAEVGVDLDRHAADTVRTALARPALERRQPGAAAARPSAPVRDARPRVDAVRQPSTDTRIAPRSYRSSEPAASLNRPSPRAPAHRSRAPIAARPTTDRMRWAAPQRSEREARPAVRAPAAARSSRTTDVRKAPPRVRAPRPASTTVAPQPTTRAPAARSRPTTSDRRSLKAPSVRKVGAAPKTDSPAPRGSRGRSHRERQ